MLGPERHSLRSAPEHTSADVEFQVQGKTRDEKRKRRNSPRPDSKPPIPAISPHESIASMETTDSVPASGIPGDTSMVIALRRSRSFKRDILRGYKVLINGQDMGRIRRGQSHEYRVLPGTHIIQLKIDWCHSPAIEVTAQAGTRVGLVCEPGGSPVRGMKAATTNTGNYISLALDKEPTNP